MYYIVDVYSYYVYDEREYAITVLAMAKTLEQIRKFAKQINEDKEYSRYFGYCHNVGVYRTEGLVPPYKFKDMRHYLSFSDLL